MATLDMLVLAMGLVRIDFIKGDIEGYEYAFIKGAKTTLRQFHPALLLEHNSEFLERAGGGEWALWDQLTSLDYQPHKLVGDHLKSIPKADWPKQGDIFWLPSQP